MLQGDTQLNGDNVGFLDGRGILDQRCFRISGQQGRERAGGARRGDPVLLSLS